MQVCNANLADKKADNILAAFLSRLLQNFLVIFYHEIRIDAVLLCENLCYKKISLSMASSE